MVTTDVSDIDDGSEDEKKPAAAPKKAEPSHVGNKPTILMTGATHARELISTNFNVYQMLKLLRLGEIEKKDDYKKLLQENKYMFMPIWNVDGVNFIEENWIKLHEILPKRKNMDLEAVQNPCEGKG